MKNVGYEYRPRLPPGNPVHKLPIAEIEQRLSTELGVQWGRRKLTIALQTALGSGKWYLDSPGTKVKGMKPPAVYYHLYWKRMSGLSILQEPAMNLHDPVVHGFPTPQSTSAENCVASATPQNLTTLNKVMTTRHISHFPIQL